MESNVFVSILTALMVQGLKKARTVPLNEGQTAKIRIVVALFSFVGSVGTSYLNGEMIDEGMIGVAADAIVNYVMATVMYTGVLKR
jgi:hypothetical protein